jgi:hypothetical protein
MVKSFIRGLAKWPSGDLAELLLGIKEILDARAQHQAEAKRTKLQRKATQHA